MNNTKYNVGDQVKVKINFGFGIAIMQVLSVCGDIVTIYHEPTGVIGQKHKAELLPVKRKIET